MAGISISFEGSRQLEPTLTMPPAANGAETDGFGVGTGIVDAHMPETALAEVDPTLFARTMPVRDATPLEAAIGGGVLVAAAIGLGANRLFRR